MKRWKKRKCPVTKYEGQRIRHLPAGTFMADFHRDGIRARKCLKTMKAAERFIDLKNVEAENKGRAAFNLSDRDRLELVELRRKVGEGVALAELTAFWQKHHPSGEAVTVEALADDFMKAKGRRGTKIVERREATTQGHEKRLKSFLEAFGTRASHEVTREDVEQWLDTRAGGELNRRHYLAAVRAMFNHGLRKGTVGTNPAEAVEMPEAATAATRIMTVKEVEKYLTAIGGECPELLPREAMAFFAGLRPEELSRLDWQNVSIENRLITIEADVAKVQGHRRHVEITDNLVRWIAPYARASGPVWPFASPTTLHRKRDKAREAAGVQVPDNAGRHAFASYHLALHENAPKTAEAMGHADVKLLKNVYRNITASDGRPITKASATEYFNIVPKPETNIIPLRQVAG